MGRADIGRLHSLQNWIATELGADRLAHRGVSAVATDHELAGDLNTLAGIEVGRSRSHVIRALLELL